ncbi:uncharacterized protein LOC142221345 [Haematobia irritans]|uniref:uncharacterized protein LOC142221345 n=1 Tax=Haematobia irritans TaxID=7368 RepID=UPI003F4FAE5C
MAAASLSSSSSVTLAFLILFNERTIEQRSGNQNAVQSTFNNIDAQCLYAATKILSVWRLNWAIALNGLNPSAETSQKCNSNTFMYMLDNILNDYARNALVVVGDANIDLIQNPCKVDLLSLLQNYDCKIAHKLVTRPDSGTCIDHVFSNFSERLFIDSVECSLSDHNMIFCKMEMQVIPERTKESFRSYCDFSKAKDVLKKNLPENFLPYTSTGIADNVIRTMENAICKSTVVLKAKEDIRFDISPWINEDLKKLIHLKEKLLKRRRKDCRKGDINEQLRRISRIIRFSIKFCRSNYYKMALDKIRDDPRKSWRFINEAMGRKSGNAPNLFGLDEEETLVQQKANEFNGYFISSLSNMKGQIVRRQDDSINFFGTLTRSRVDFRLQNVELETVKDVIIGMNVNKCSGSDNISPKFLKRCVDEVAPAIKEMINKIINTSEYPGCLKMHKIIPIPKKTNARNIENFRPISILSSVDKIFEKILFDRLSSYITENQFMYKFQYGFRKGCGVNDAALNVVQFICNSLDTGFSGVAGLFFDFTKAFDLVDHNIMQSKLEYYGIRGSELNLFKSYFENRKQFVQLGKSRSFVGPVLYGIPQGSGLGPLLFSLYLNDLGNLGLEGKLFMFADDFCLFYPYKYDTVLRARVERDVAMLLEFVRLNGLVLNPAKTQLIRFRPHSSTLNHDFIVNIDGTDIKESHVVKYLGITLQSNMSWDLHINEIKGKIAPALELTEQSIEDCL